AFRSDRLGPSLARADADDVVDGKNEYLSVADAAGPGGLADRRDDVRDLVIAHDDFDLDLGHGVHGVLRAAIELRASFLPSEPINFGDGEALDADVVKMRLYLFELEGRDDSFNLLHVALRALLRCAPIRSTR